MAISTSAGTKIYIGPVNTTANTKSAYAALSYTEIGGVETISEFGDTAQIATFLGLGDARVRKYKGADDAGDVTITVGNDATNAGQIAAIAASKTKFDYAFKVVTADGADSNDTDSTFYFRGPMTSRRVTIGGANDVTKRAFVIAINSEIIEDPSTVVSGS